MSDDLTSLVAQTSIDDSSSPKFIWYLQANYGVDELCVEVLSKTSPHADQWEVFDGDVVGSGSLEEEMFRASAHAWGPGLAPIAHLHDTSAIAADMWKRLVAESITATILAGEPVVVGYYAGQTKVDEEGKYTVRLGYRHHPSSGFDDPHIDSVVLKSIPMKIITVGVETVEYWPEDSFGPDEPAHSRQYPPVNRTEFVVDWKNFVDPDTRLTTQAVVEEVSDDE